MIPKKIKEEAFAMYCAGIIPFRINQMLSIKNNSTVYKWIKNEDWDERRNNILKEKENNSVLADDERDLKLIETVLSLWIKAVKEKEDHLKDKINVGDLLDAIKMRRLISGKSTENVNMSGEVWKVKEEVDRILKEGEDE